MPLALNQKLKAKKTSTPERELSETLQCDLSVINPLDLSARPTVGAGPVPLCAPEGRSSTLARSSSFNSLSTQSESKGSAYKQGNAGVCSDNVRTTTTTTRTGPVPLGAPKASGSTLARASSLSTLSTQSESKLEEESYTEEDLLLTTVSNARLQSELMKYLVQKRTEKMQKDLDEELYRLQKEIEKEQERQMELKSRLNTIKTNTEIEKLLDVKEGVTERLVEKLKSGKVGENMQTKCEAMTKELEKYEDKIICKNITIPETDESIEELRLVIGETKEAFEELTLEIEKQQIDESIVEALGKTLQSTVEFAERQERCQKGLKELETLTAKENTLRIMVAVEEEMKKKNPNVGKFQFQ